MSFRFVHRFNAVSLGQRVRRTALTEGTQLTKNNDINYGCSRSIRLNFLLHLVVLRLQVLLYNVFFNTMQ